MALRKDRPPFCAPRQTKRRPGAVLSLGPELFAAWGKTRGRCQPALSGHFPIIFLKRRNSFPNYSRCCSKNGKTAEWHPVMLRHRRIINMEHSKTPPAHEQMTNHASTRFRQRGIRIAVVDIVRSNFDRDYHAGPRVSALSVSRGRIAELQALGVLRS